MRALARPLVATVVGTLWVSLFWFKPPGSWPQELGMSRRFVLSTVSAWTGLPGIWSWVVASLVLGGLLPAVLLLLSSRQGTPSLLGPGSRAGWRLAGLAYLGALPFLWWLASRPSFRDYYEPMLRGGLGGPAVRFVLVITAEHICIQGAVLRLALGVRPPWPALPLPMDHASGWQRLAGALGLAGAGGPAARLGVDGRVLLALGVQAWVFGWVHVSKDLGELFLSFPGGLALGYLAWRSRSVWPCVALHAATGGSVIGLSYLLYG
ncbi:MAG: CPBP family intramembrane glutamic endopeptidase [Pseudomonadota bacterium]